MMLHLFKRKRLNGHQPYWCFLEGEQIALVELTGKLSLRRMCDMKKNLLPFPIIYFTRYRHLLPTLTAFDIVVTMKSRLLYYDERCFFQTKLNRPADENEYPTRLNSEITITNQKVNLLTY